MDEHAQMIVRLDRIERLLVAISDLIQSQEPGMNSAGRMLANVNLHEELQASRSHLPKEAKG